MTNGHRHNLSVAWIRLWGALGAQVVADQVYAGTACEAVARELAAYENKRYSTACYAVGTTATL